MNETDSTRLDSHDYRYQNGDYVYHDTYVGGEKFAGQEAVWKSGKAQYAMNYLGRVLEKEFSGNFLKEALRKADKKMPYRGPEYYQNGEYTYKCSVNGAFDWFQGYEEIYWNDKKSLRMLFPRGKGGVAADSGTANAVPDFFINLLCKQNPVPLQLNATFNLGVKPLQLLSVKRVGLAFEDGAKGFHFLAGKGNRAVHVVFKRGYGHRANFAD
jgi:hypothetical protein